MFKKVYFFVVLVYETDICLPQVVIDVDFVVSEIMYCFHYVNCLCSLHHIVPLIYSP